MLERFQDTVLRRAYVRLASGSIDKCCNTHHESTLRLM